MSARTALGAAPEARQVPGDLDRPVRRRQQVQRQRHAARRRASDGGRGRTAPAPARRRRAALGRVVDGDARAGRRRRNGSAPRRPGAAAGPRAAARAGPRRGRRRSMRGEAAPADDAGRQPVVAVAARAASDRSGHSSPSGAAQEGDAVAPAALAACVQGRRPMPSRRQRPRPGARAASPSCDDRREARSRRTSAPERRTRGPAALPAAASKVDLVGRRSIAAERPRSPRA